MPDHLLPLHAVARHRAGNLASGDFSQPKLALVGMLNRLGLLPRVVPAYGVLARKP